VGENFSVETQSLLTNHFAFNSSVLPTSYTLKQSIIQFSSFWDLTFNIMNCSQQQTVYLKVFHILFKLNK
jgi:hypothetical protein